MGTLDYIVIALFAIAMIGIVVWVFKQKQKSSGDFFWPDVMATWLAIGASIFASNIGSEHLIGLAGAGASSGMAMAHWEIQGWMILILGWVFVPFYSRSMVLTMPEFLERRYNKESRTILSVISLVSYVLTKVAVTVYAGGLVFKEVFGIQELWGIDFFWSLRSVGTVDCFVYGDRWYEIGALYFCASNSDFADRFFGDSGVKFESCRRLGSGVGSLSGDSGK